jgi:protein O-mannosyl-transferase
MARARHVTNPPAIDPQRPRFFLPALALVFITLLAYIPVFQNGFIWDDDSYVTANSTLQSVEGLEQIWANPHATPQYYPLVHSTFWLEYHLWGDTVVGYHIDNLLLHAISAVLLWRLLRKLKVPLPWLAAAIWAVHPINVESVAWITERKNVLSGLLYFLAFGAYLRFLGIRDGDQSEDGGWKMEDGKTASAPSSILHPPSSLLPYFAAATFFALALLSKTVTSTFPAAVLLILWWKRGRIRLRDVTPLLPFFVAGIGMGAVTGYLERSQVGAQGPDFTTLTPIDRVLIAGRAVWFYAGKLLVPLNLSFIYPRWHVDSHLAWQYLYPAAAVIVTIALWMLRHRIGRGPLVATLFFIGTLFPALGFVNVYPMRFSFVADHFQYLAGIGFITLVTAAICRFVKRRPVRQFLSVLILITLITLTFQECLNYRDALTLWLDTAEKNPRSWMVHANIGHIYKAQHRYDLALAEYQQSLEYGQNEPEPHDTMGWQLAARGKLDEAITEFREAIAIDPGYAPAYANLAKAMIDKGDLAQAELLARQATAIAPHMPEGWGQLGIALELQSRLTDAANAYESAARANPSSSQMQIDAANALIKLSRYPQAIDYYRRAVAIDPDNAAAWTTLGELLVRSGQLHEGQSCLDRARQIQMTKPESPNQ